MKKIISLILSLSITLLAENIVTDTKASLMWQDENLPDSLILNFEDAKDYCEELNLEDHSDWRLPIIDELSTLIDRSKLNPAVKTFIVNTKTGFYWSSTQYKGNITSAWGVHFYDGGSFWDRKTNRNFVRCVRSVEEE